MTGTASVGRPRVRDRVRSYVELTKPRIVELLLVTTVPTMVLAADGWPGTRLVLATLVGGILSSGGANTMNQVIDRDLDATMRRTLRRPIPSGRVRPGAALVFGILLGVSGFLWLWATTNLLAAALSTGALLFYVLVYSLLLKRSSTQNIVLGGAAGAVPALVGWAAVTGGLAVPAWLAFGLVFFWTPPHFWALALKYEDDYRRAGVPMLPVVVGREPTLRQILAYSVVVVGLSLLLVPAAGLGLVYLLVAGPLGVVLVGWAGRLLRRPGEAMRFFGFTNLYLAAVFVAMAVDRLVT
ncbi:MAG TPA: protoheme IX farnesyltransferase [Actinobacteria bacterium]|nr:protoheme IX farnesyltransferase [Actinomycetota bacterium]